MKDKIGFGLRIFTLLFFCLVITTSFSIWNEPTPYLFIAVLLLLLLNFSQLLNPISIKKNLLLYLGMIAYTVLIYSWYSNYGFKREFDYKGETLTYEYSPFNGSYATLFGYNQFNNTMQNNESRKKDAISFFIFLQCDYYQTELNYTPKQKEAIKNGTLKIIQSNRYSKGNLKDFILESVKNDKEYYTNYQNLTKQSTVEIDSVLKYRYQLFNLRVEE
ncbi:hypothetical protein [Flavobacterium sp.]|uniref:hypothetical protein n=1 Tax=Flavobacterium sp. TaxID=239 RepID=UPI0024879A42|nr:hypothetical protein [Flavobacterium sp.]MDI1317794.1 hypothetical protein [Flavobacterium sp.]